MATTPHPPTFEPRPTQTPADDADLHLQRMLLPEVSWRESFVQNIKDLFNPPKLPPLDVTSKPIAVKDIWGETAANKIKAGFGSLLVPSPVLSPFLFIPTNQPLHNIP